MVVGFVQCTIQTGYWMLGLCNAQFQLGVIVGLGTTLHNFMGQQSLSLRNLQNNPGGQCWAEMCIFWEGYKPFLPQIVQCYLNEGRARANVGQTHWRETERKYDSECMATLSERRSDWQCTQT